MVRAGMPLGRANRACTPFPHIQREAGAAHTLAQIRYHWIRTDTKGGGSRAKFSPRIQSRKNVSHAGTQKLTVKTLGQKRRGRPITSDIRGRGSFGRSRARRVREPSFSRVGESHSSGSFASPSREKESDFGRPAVFVIHPTSSPSRQKEKLTLTLVVSART